MPRQFFYSSVILATLAMLGLPHSAAGETGGAKGAFVEVGGVFAAPFAGEKIATDDPDYGFPQLDLDPGGGFQIAGGYGFGIFSIGGRTYYVYLPEDPAGAPTGVPFPQAFGTNTGADLWGMEVEARLFPLGTGTSIVQPYLVAGVGWGVFNSDFEEGELIGSSNFGIGIQVAASELVYIGAEGSYRPVWGADECGEGSSFSGPVFFACDNNEDVHIAQAALSLGFRF